MKLIFISIFFFLSWGYAAELENEEWHVISCTILNSKGSAKYSFQGLFCNFLDDGSYISYVFFPDGRYIVRFGANNQIIWKRKFDVHHQLKLSADKKKLIALTVEFVKTPICKTTRYDNFSVLDVETGKSLFSWNSADHINKITELKMKYSSPILMSSTEAKPNATVCKITHLNSVYEIPENQLSNKIPAFKAGNFIVNFLGLGAVLIVDQKTKEIIWESSLKRDNFSYLGLHDVQVLDTGELMYLRNSEANRAQQKYSRFEIHNPITFETRIIYPTKLADNFTSGQMGGIQKIDTGYLLSANSNEEGGWVIKIDAEGNQIYKYFNPEKDQAENRPLYFQDVKTYDLRGFLKKNYLVRKSIF